MRACEYDETLNRRHFAPGCCPYIPTFAGLLLAAAIRIGSFRAGMHANTMLPGRSRSA